MQIGFSRSVDRINHQRILNKICSVGIGGSVLFVLTQFLSNRSKHVMEDGCWSKLVNVVMKAAGQCFGPIIVPIQKVKTHNFLYCTSMLLVNRTFVRISDLFLGWLILSATYYACVHHAVWKSSCFDCNFSSHYLFEYSYHACV